MSAFGEACETEPPSADPVAVRLDEILDELEAVVTGSRRCPDRSDSPAGEAARAATAALQVAESVRFAQSQVAEQLAADVHPDKIGRGIVEQIGLACRISLVIAARRLNTARALWFELPDTYTQLIAGELSERAAETVVAETRHLDPELRRQVDEQLNAAGIARMGFKAATASIRKTAYQADPHRYLERGRTERQHRRIGVRPAPDTMAVLTGYLLVEQGIACYTALRQHADAAVATGDDRTRDQIMADTDSLSRSRIALGVRRRRRLSPRKNASSCSSSVRRRAIPDARGSGRAAHRAGHRHRCQCGTATHDATRFPDQLR